MQQRGRGGADQRPDDRHPRVAPVAAALAADRQDRVGEPRAEVARRVDRVAGRPAERQPDRQHQQRHRQGVERPEPVRRRGDLQHPEHEHEGGDGLGQEVVAEVADRRRGAEHPADRRRLGGRLELPPVGQPHDHPADEGAQQLRAHVRRDSRPRELAAQRQRQGDGRVQVGPADRRDRVDRHEHRRRPAGRDRDQPAPVPVCARQRDVGDHAVAEDDKDRGPEELGGERGHRRRG
nr:hypothetical protein [Nannocystis radixulma]